MEPPPLWLTPDRVARVRSRLATGDPTAVAILAAARARPDLKGSLPPTTETLTAAAVAACLDGDADLATQAAEAWLTVAESARCRGNLARADVALTGAAIGDAVSPFVSADLRVSLHAMLHALALGFRDPDLVHGDPHVVTNNHWGVSHAAAAIAAMASHDGTSESHDRVAWARGRLRAYLRLHGDAGLYHEGVGYQLYPAAFWLPYVLASRAFDGTDELACIPGLAEACTSLYALARPSAAPSGHGCKLSWNDDGAEWCDSGAAVLLAALAPAPRQGALRSLFDRLNGVAGDRRFGPRHAGLFFALAAYPFDAATTDPHGVLPRHIIDARQGFVVFRNGYRDADDVILGGYARCSHPGGHSHDDAGSLRFAALGHDWIVGGGQNRPHAAWQSLVTPATGERPAKPYACGALAWCEDSPTGGVFAFDLRRPSQAYAERWVAVDYGGRAGCPAALAVLDVLDDHTSRDWHWNLSLGDGVEFRPHDDGCGFELTGTDGARLSSRFLGQEPAGLELARMPDSARTYQSGHRETYPGRPFVRAVFPNHAHRAMYWVATVRRGAPVDIRLADGDGHDVVLDGQPWRRPFGAGVAASFRPDQGGTPSRHPRGAPPS